MENNHVFSLLLVKKKKLTSRCFSFFSDGSHFFRSGFAKFWSLCEQKKFLHLYDSVSSHILRLNASGANILYALFMSRVATQYSASKEYFFIS